MKTKSYWIILSHAKGSIWKQTFDSYAEAKKELNLQVGKQGANYKGDWHIEERNKVIDDNKKDDDIKPDDINF